MDTHCSRRKFLNIVVVLFGGMILWLAGCGGSSHGQSAPIPISVAYGTTVLDTLRMETAITTRDTSFGKEVIGVGKYRAVKGTNQDDGFVILVDGTPPGSALDQSYLHVIGAHTIEVRSVPFGKRGEEGTPILTFAIDVR
ncbi:hypothetical protein HY625_00065 [Candidatus Uhrbacteria bacterium]|nr:hypothetical protein [Candidatus Uhrbacteria bacterium]